MSRNLCVLAIVGLWLSGEIAARAQGEKEPPWPALAAFPPLQVAAGDSPAAKLKKEKFNAALSAFGKLAGQIRSGLRGRTYGDAGMLEATRSLKEAILDLDDPAFRMKAFDAYVDLTRLAEAATMAQFEAGAIDPYKCDLARYRRLDAELLQLSLKKKQAEKK